MLYLSPLCEREEIRKAIPSTLEEVQQHPGFSGESLDQENHPDDLPTDLPMS